MCSSPRRPRWAGKWSSRLAALVGDRDGAIRAYRHYLVLREHPEPALEPQVAEVRKELAKLLAETR